MRFNKIFDAFPPPKFLSIPFTGVSISDTAIHCIQFDQRDNRLHIVKYAERRLPSGVVTSGQINNKDALITELTTLKNDLGLSYVKVSLPEEKAYLFTAKIPIIKKEEVRSAIESKIEENVPVSPDQLVFDYKLIDHSQKGHLDVVVSALSKSVVDEYIDVINSSGLSPISLEIESQAIARALILFGFTDTVLVVNFGLEKVGLYIVTERVVRFTSTVSTKGELLRNPDYLLQEIKRLYMYWHTLKENIDKPERKIIKIIVCGEGFQDKIIQYLSTSNPTPIEFGNVWTNAFDLDIEVPEILFAESLRYAAVIGLALPTPVLMQKSA